MAAFLIAGCGGDASGPQQQDLFSGGRSVETLMDDLVPKEDFRPFPGYEDRQAWQSLPVDFSRQIIDAAEAALGYSWPNIPVNLIFEFFETGARTPYEALAYEKRNNLWTLLIAEMIEGEGRFLREIVNGVWSICEESTWVLPAHLNQWYEEGQLPDIENPYLDTIAGETASLLSWVYYFLGDELDSISPVVSKRIYDEVNRRVLTPALERDHWWMGFDPERTRRVNNWNPWNNSNWLTALLILEGDSELRARSVYRITKALDRFTNPYPADGGCDEGPAYWGVAAGSLFDNIELLNAATGGSFESVFEKELIRNMGTYVYKVHMGNDYVANFADSGPQVNPVIGGLVYRYGKALGNETMKAMGSYLYTDVPVDDEDFNIHDFNHLREILPIASRRNWRVLSDLFAFDEIVSHPSREPMVLDAWLPVIEVMTARSVEGSVESFAIAAKGGHNDESHNHNDIGNFIVYYQGEPILIDVGLGTYTRRTFGADRYTVWLNRSDYHNVPTINGFEQRPGPDYRSREVAYHADAEVAKLSLDIAGAYPEAAGVESWSRSIQLVRGSEVLIEDNYSLQNTGSIKLNLMTVHAVEPAGEGVLNIKTRKGRRIQLDFDPTNLEVEIERLALDGPEDPGVVDRWGDRMYRIRLIDRNPDTEGRYSLCITDLAPTRR
ncbi:MAG: heparinase II/III family protein [Opitutales bacterium]|nr:heparinase II/III family protein [Opitutales bacterium]